MNFSEAELVDAAHDAYDRGWTDCLNAIIELCDKHTVPALSAVLRELRDNPPPKEIETA